MKQRVEAKRDKPRKKLMREMLVDPCFPDQWRKLDTLMHVIGSNEIIIQRLLLEIDSRGSEDGHFVKTGSPCLAGWCDRRSGQVGTVQDTCRDPVASGTVRDCSNSSGNDRGGIGGGLGAAFVAGSILLPKPAAGITAFTIFLLLDSVRISLRNGRKTRGENPAARSDRGSLYFCRRLNRFPFHLGDS